MSNPIYKWLVAAGAGGTQQQMYPVYKDDLAIEYAAESGEQFLRPQLSGRIDFIGADYDTIMTAVENDFATVFYVYLEKSNIGGLLWDDYWNGKFTITDCTVNVDDKRISVQPQVVDIYTDVLDGMEKEYDLIKLTPVIESIVVRKRPMIQIYTSGEDIVNCIVGQESFEQDASLPSDQDEEKWMVEHCHFFVVSGITELNFVNGPAGFTQPFTGIIHDGNYLTNSEGLYVIQYYEWFTISSVNQRLYKRMVNGLHIMDANTLEVLWEYEQEKYTYNMNDVYEPLPVEIPFGYVGSSTGPDLEAVRHSQNVYMRIVTNCGVYEDGATFGIPGDDITGYNRNYLRCMPYERYDNNIIQSSAYSTTPTEWGRRDDGNYFVRPNDRALPIGRSNWINTSLWFVPGSESINIDLGATDAYILNDAYPIWSVIKVLLAQFSTVTFDGTTDYSQFLFSGSDPIGGKDLAMYITPKSNITAGEYQKPAMKAPITLRSVLTMLRNTFQLYWHIDAYGRLRIEHIAFYRNGQSYSGTPTVGIDLTTMTAPRNGKKWDFGTNEYSFDKVDMPQRYVFKWMDEVTQVFKGNAIMVNSPYVQLDKEEEVSAGDFTSDIDYLLLNGNGVSQEGFAVMTCEAANVLDAWTYEKGEGPDTWVAPIGSAFRGKTVSAFLRIYGTGTAYLVWWRSGQREVTNTSFNLYYEGTVSLVIPDDAEGMAFTGDGITAGGAEIHLTVTSQQMRQVVIARFNELNERVQNYNLAYYFMQNPYWMYDMPAKSVTVNGSAVTASGVMRKKKQTLNVPVGNNDPAMLQLIKTGIGNGTIEKMDINLSSRMAKTVLKYDTEQ